MPSAAPAGAAPVAPAGCELADVLARYGPAYEATHRLTRSQRRAVRDITRCRTAELGGHREWCETCGFERFVYHSCRNRHCPKCQTIDTAAWVAARQRELLPVPYFHNVFTLPHELNPLVLGSERNQRALLGLLFSAAAGTLLEFGRRDLGGTIGCTLVLHTWDQQLRPHFHVHALIPSGALAPDGSRWIAGGRQFLFPVHGLSRLFRGKYLDALERLLAEGRLDLPPQLRELAETPGLRRFLQRLRRKAWVVYSQPPFAGPKKLLDYLGRYTHRTAIANHRLLSCEDGQVRFTYRDRADGDRQKIATLSAEAFLSRFLLHVLPARFQRIRHYGLLANRGKAERLDHCRALLGATAIAASPQKPQTAADWMRAVLDLDPDRCPCCGDVLHRERLDPQPARFAHPPIHRAPWDTS